VSTMISRSGLLTFVRESEAICACVDVVLLGEPADEAIEPVMPARHDDEIPSVSG